MDVSMHAYTYACMNVCTHLCVYMCMYVYMTQGTSVKMIMFLKELF